MRITIALSALIGGNFELVAADVHTAPSARAFLACVKEVNDTGFAFANAVGLGLAQEIGRVVNDWRPQVRRFLEVQERFPYKPAVSPAKRPSISISWTAEAMMLSN